MFEQCRLARLVSERQPAPSCGAPDECCLGPCNMAVSAAAPVGSITSGSGSITSVGISCCTSGSITSGSSGITNDCISCSHLGKSHLQRVPEEIELRVELEPEASLVRARIVGESTHRW